MHFKPFQNSSPARAERKVTWATESLRWAEAPIFERGSPSRCFHTWDTWRGWRFWPPRRIFATFLSAPRAERRPALPGNWPASCNRRWGFLCCLEQNRSRKLRTSAAADKNNSSQPHPLTILHLNGICKRLMQTIKQGCTPQARHACQWWLVGGLKMARMWFGENRVYIVII